MKEGAEGAEGGVGPEPLSTSGPSTVEHSQKLPNRAGPQQGTVSPVDDQRCPQPRRQHTNAHPRGWPPGALMGGQGDTQRRRDSILPPPSTRSWSLNPIRQVLDATLGLRSEAEERQGRMEEGPQSGEGSTLPADGQDGPVGRLRGSGTSRAGRVPPSCPQEPTSPLLPWELDLQCGIHVSHTEPNVHSPTRPP